MSKAKKIYDAAPWELQRKKKKNEEEQQGARQASKLVARTGCIISSEHVHLHVGHVQHHWPASNA